MDYKKYSLENLENWLHDAMSTGEATPQEIYDVIVNVVKDNYYTYKHQTFQAYELLALLNGNGKGHVKACDNVTEHSSYYYEYDRNDANRENPFTKKEDKVVKWQLPVEVDGASGEYFVTFPDDLLDAANLKEGDAVKWIDRGDGSYELRKVTKPLAMDEC